MIQQVFGILAQKNVKNQAQAELKRNKQATSTPEGRGEAVRGVKAGRGGSFRDSWVLLTPQVRVDLSGRARGPPPPLS